MIGWLALIPAVIFMCLAWTVCGFAMLAAVGVRQAKWYLASPAAACCFFGLISLLSTVFGWSFLLLGCCLLIALATRLLLDKPLATRFNFPTLKDTVSEVWADARHLQPDKAFWGTLTIVGSACAVFVIIASSCGGTDLVPQNYDMPFHLSALKRIMDTAHASPIGAGSVMGDASAIYPDLWHANAALAATTFGLTIQQSTWVTLLAITMFVLPCSVILLTDVLFRQTHGVSFCLVALLTVCGQCSPISFITFGPVLSNLYGLSILPAAIAFASAGEQLRIPIGSRCLCNLMMFGGLCFAHPNIGIAYLVLILPYLVVNVTGLVKKAALVCALVVGWFLCMRSSLFFRTINCLDRVPDDILAGKSFFSDLGLNYEVLSTQQWFPLLATLLIVGIAIAVAALTHKRWKQSWYLVSVSILIAQVACSAFPENGFTKAFTGFWYRDFFRFATISGFFLAFIVGAIPELLAQRIAYAKVLKGSVGLTVAALVFALCGVRAVAVAKQDAKAHRDGLRGVVVDTYNSDDPACLTAERAEFCKRIKDEVGNAGVLNNHNDSSVWLYSLFDINAQANGRPANQVSPMSDELYTLTRFIDTYGEASEEGEATRQAAARLGVEYVVQMSDLADMTTKFTSDGTIDYQPADAITRVNENTPGFELVLESNGMRLWKLVPPQ